MFKENDKLTLILTHAQNAKGEMLPLAWTLPLKRELKLTQDIKSIDVFECHEGSIRKSSLIYTLYIGSKAKLSSIASLFSKIHVNVSLSSLSDGNFKKDNEVLYHIDNDGNAIIDAFLKPQDVVFSSLEEMTIGIYELSEYCKQLNKVTSQIKLFRKLD